ncbi:MAG: NUDIX domain-containing protein [Clostridia bacterium]|nr:NUDIX domain-containing protein [Clostridia bacterium]
MDTWVETKQFPSHLLSAAGLVYKENKVLLIRSPRRGWEFPGGVIEQGEVITDGLKREIWEESGILAEPLALAGVNQNLALKKGYGPLEGMLLPPVVIFDFICVYVGGTETLSEESQEIGWFFPEEAVKLVQHPGYAERLRTMLRFSGTIKLAAYEKTAEAFRNYREIDLEQAPYSSSAEK